MPEIDISPKSIKISYLRFLSDSAPGYMAILLIWILDHYIAKTKIVDAFFANPKTTTEIKVALGVFVVFISNPIGLGCRSFRTKLGSRGSKFFLAMMSKG